MHGCAIETNWPLRDYLPMLRSLLRLVIGVLVIGSIALVGRDWLHRHPEHDPWAPLTLTAPVGWATASKFENLRNDRSICRAFLDASGIAFTALPPTGSGECLRADRQVISSPQQADVRLVPRGAQATCAVDAGLAWWLHHGVQPAAQTILGSRVVSIEHFGTNSCRRISGSENWSEHASGNAFDVSAFELANGERIVVSRDWDGPGDAAAFLRKVRDTACQSFATVLSPDYNAAHADHLHLDQANRTSGWTACQ